MSTRQSTNDRRLRSHVSDEDTISEVSEVEFNYRTPASSRSNSESENGGNETILNADDNTNMSEQGGRGRGGQTCCGRDGY